MVPRRGVATECLLQDYLDRRSVHGCVKLFRATLSFHCQVGNALEYVEQLLRRQKANVNHV